MGILYQASDPMIWAIWLFVVFALMAFNEFGRTSVWGGVTLFIVARSCSPYSSGPTPRRPATNTERATGSTGLKPIPPWRDASDSWRCGS